MRTRIKRWMLLLEAKLNVPDFVENPWRKNKDDTTLFLKEVFHGYPFVTLLSEKGCSEIYYERTTIGNASLVTVNLERDQEYRVWIAEGVECNYSGSIWVYKSGSGKIRYSGDKTAKYVFYDVEAIRFLTDRIIVRRVFEFLKTLPCEGVQVDFGWAKNFTGKLNERIVFFDFEPLGESS